MFGCLKPSLGPNAHLFNLPPASVDPYGEKCGTYLSSGNFARKIDDESWDLGRALSQTNASGSRTLKEKGKEKQPVASRDYLVELEGQACHHFQTQTANYGRKTRTKIFKYLQICRAAKIACLMETSQVSIFKAPEILRIS